MGTVLIAWVHPNYPDHEGEVIGQVRRAGCPSGAELYRELAFPFDGAGRLAERIAAGCRCGWRSARWSPAAPTTYGPFSVLACPDDAARALELWERHLVVDVGGDRRGGAVAHLPMRVTIAELLQGHRALAGATDEERRQLAADLETAMVALGRLDRS